MSLSRDIPLHMTHGKTTYAPRHHEEVGGPSSSSSVSNDFLSCGVNPDVIPVTPNALCTVAFGSKQVELGAELTVDETQAPPTLHWQEHAHTNTGGTQFYTVIMCDPDAPSFRTPTYRSWCHWVVVNVPSWEHLDHGDVICKYQGPAPPEGTGLHRYVVLVYAQQHGISARALPHIDGAQRKSWDVSSFLSRTGGAIDHSRLVAGNMFRAQNPISEAEGRRAHREASHQEHKHAERVKYPTEEKS